MRSKMSLKEWLPLFGITVSAFIFNTSEFMPIGLLTDIADRYCRQLSYYRSTCRGTDHSIFMDCYVTVSAVDAFVE